MAIFYCQMSVISRGSGRSAVAASAYRSAETLTNERDGLVHKYENRQGVEHAEIVLPDGASAEWAKGRSALWNAAEASEKRKDARVAREFVIALPHELSAEARLELTQEFAQDLANRYGAAVDFAIHAPHPQGDVRNHHAHVMMTTRQVTAEGLGNKTYLELANKELLPRGLPTTQMQLVDIRRGWEGMANERLAREGFDARIDHRSHQERGLEIEPTEHVGVRATNIQRRGGEIDRARIDDEAARRNAELIREKPEQVLTLLTNEKSVFDRRDIARTLHRYVNDDAQTFQNAFAAIMASPALVELQPERVDRETGEVSAARYSTREMVEIETGMALSAERMAETRSHGVDRRHVERSIEHHDAAIQKGSGDTSARLSAEQRHAIEHITGPERIAAVVGFAGAGKSTMLAAAREAWEAQGYTVHGAALSGKAAEGLEESSGIQSRTLASWSRGWERNRHQLGRGDVFVIDEAGMIGSRQMAQFVGEAEQRGAKIVLVGDHEQLQAIGAGAPFRAIAEQIGHAELSDIRRQRVDWQREASVAFATHKTPEGLAAYREHGDIHLAGTGDEARAAIVRDYLADRDARSGRDDRPDGTRVAMAHRRADVHAINAAIRTELQERGDLPKMPEAGELATAGPAGGEQERPRALSYQTDNGRREFAEGDRIVFLQNDHDLGVKNGMLGTVKAVEPHQIEVQLDGRGGESEFGSSLSVPIANYQAIDHGYATTIHKNQGATVDRTFVLASGSMDRHLTYVAMTRHRDRAQLYASAEEFADRSAGKLVEHGVAPYEHRQGERESYFVTLENAKGERHTTWGVDLGRAMAEAKPEIGATVGLRHEGSVAVTLPDGTETHRNAWRVQDAGDLAYARLEERLSRSGAKETTLDYVRDFAERRGIAEAVGVRSEIDIPLARRQERQSEQIVLSRPAELRHTDDVFPGHEQGRSSVEHGVDEERARLKAGPDRLPLKAGQDVAQDPLSDRREDLAAERGDHQRPDARPGRSMFAGLKLARGSAGERAQQDRSAENSPKAGREDRQQVPRPRRGMFDGLRLNAGRGSPVDRPERESERVAPDRATSDRLAERIRPMSGFEQAVDGYARAFSSAVRQHHEGLPILEGQRREIDQAGQRLDQFRPGSTELLHSAMHYDPKAAEAMTQLSGRERVGQLVAGMDREQASQANPSVRADRFIERWNELKSERQQLAGWQHDNARGKVETEMRGMSQGLERDPQLESVLRNRSQEMGISPVRQEQNLLKEMDRQMEQNRSQSQGMER